MILPTVSLNRFHEFSLPRYSREVEEEVYRGILEKLTAVITFNGAFTAIRGNGRGTVALLHS